MACTQTSVTEKLLIYALHRRAAIIKHQRVIVSLPVFVDSATADMFRAAELCNRQGNHSHLTVIR